MQYIDRGRVQGTYTSPGCLFFKPKAAVDDLQAIASPSIAIAFEMVYLPTSLVRYKPQLLILIVLLPVPYSNLKRAAGRVLARRAFCCRQAGMAGGQLGQQGHRRRRNSWYEVPVRQPSWPCLSSLVLTTNDRSVDSGLDDKKTAAAGAHLVNPRRPR